MPSPSPVYKDEVLGRRVAVQFVVGGRKRFFKGTIQRVNMTLASPSAAVVIHHYVSFDDNEEDWFDLILLEKKKTLQWLDEHDKQPVVKATPKRKATKRVEKKDPPGKKRNISNSR
jgi:hypothetical protein